MSNRIRFGEMVEPEPPVEQLPPDALVLRDLGRWRHTQARFQLYMVEGVYQKIWNHLSQTLNIEGGGVLVGHPFKTFDRQIAFVVVAGAIPQHSDNRSAAHFTVGPTEIARARVELERSYPGLAAVGWYHSHPGHGIFLSDQDMTIVQSIYNASWHIAMVIDPRQRLEGVFVGGNGAQLGGQGYDKPGYSWISLQAVPDSIKAIALYNQLQEHQAALAKFRNLTGLVQQSKQLQHWRQAGYRDLAGPSPGDSKIQPNKSNRLWFPIFGGLLIGLILGLVIIILLSFTWPKQSSEKLTPKTQPGTTMPGATTTLPVSTTVNPALTSPPVSTSTFSSPPAGQ